MRTHSVIVLGSLAALACQVSASPRALFVTGPIKPQRSPLAPLPASASENGHDQVGERRPSLGIGYLTPCMDGSGYSPFASPSCCHALRSTLLLNPVVALHRLS